MRKRAFTLIELLVVISILVLLMGIMLPAVIKARQVFTALQGKDQVMALAKACNSYSVAFDQQGFPAVQDSPSKPRPAGTPSMITGAQSLCLALTGYTMDSKNISTPGNPDKLNLKNQGVADDPTKYDPNYPNTVYRQFYTPRPGEVVRYSDTNPAPFFMDSTDPNFAAYSRDLPVFVDFMFKPARPILYFRMHPAIANSMLVYWQYDYGDNAVYCGKGQNGQPNELLQQTPDPAWNLHGGYFNVSVDDLKTYITSNGTSTSAYADGLVIIGAGPDRVYFTGDDANTCGK